MSHLTESTGSVSQAPIPPPIVARYTPVYGKVVHADMEEDPDGDWVSLDDYQKLEQEVLRLRAALDFISTADDGGQEIYPSGPLDVEYSEDGNTVVRYVPPWYFLRGKGATFLEAVEMEMARKRI